MSLLRKIMGFHTRWKTLAERTDERERVGAVQRMIGRNSNTFIINKRFTILTSDGKPFIISLQMILMMLILRAAGGMFSEGDLEVKKLYLSYSRVGTE